MPVKQLFLVRHGEAVSETTNPERPLAPTGRAQVERTAAIMANVLPDVDVMYHSGKARAEETADILATRIKAIGGIRWRRGLQPNDPVDEVLGELDTEDEERVLVAGHLPFLARWASYLLCGRADPPLVNFSTGAAAALTREEEGWVLSWMIDPSQTAP